MNREKLIQDLTLRPKVKVEGVVGLKQVNLKPVISNIRPDGFTFYLSYAPAALGAPQAAFGSFDGPWTLPYSCLLKSASIQCEVQNGGNNFPQDPNFGLLRIWNGAIPITNPGFTLASSLGAHQANWADFSGFAMNGSANNRDLSSYGLIHNSLYVYFSQCQPGLVNYAIGDSFIASILLRFDRYNP